VICWEKCISFIKKLCMTLSFDVRQNGPEINLPVSRVQRTFGPGHRQRIYCCTWRGDNHLLDRNQVSPSQGIHLYSCWPPEEPSTIVIDRTILDALEHYPFSSIRELTCLTCISIPTVHRYLTQSLGFVVKHLCWVPHTLTPPQKTEPATLSIELLRQLRSIEHHGW
jgi:hypothetical protein